MKIKAFVLGGVFAVVTAGCGGGGGGDNDGIQLENPSVSVTGLAAGEDVTVELNGGSAQKTISSDGTYRYSTEIDKDDTYSLSVASTSGPTCVFPNGNDSISGVTPSDKTPVLDCQGGTGGGGGGTGGGGGGSASQIDPPFKLYGWLGEQLSVNDPANSDPSAKMAMPISILDENNNPLTGANLSNFTFYEDGEEIVNSSEYPLHVEPMPDSQMALNITIALDISSSLSDSQLSTLKNALKTFVSNQPTDTLFSLYTFDSVVNNPVSYQDHTTMDTAIDNIDTSLEGSRDSSTDLYGAITDAANNLVFGALTAARLGYVVVITDGVHNSSGDDPSTTEDAVEDHLVYGVGIGDRYDPAELQTAIGDPEGAGQTLFQAGAASDVTNHLNSISNRVTDLLSGLHMVYYRTPRRDGSEHDINLEATPLDECAAATDGEDACGFVYTYNTTLNNVDVVKEDRVFIAAGAVRAAPGETVTYRIPEWSYCTFNPDYQWSLNVNQGSATENVIDGGQALEVTFGSAPIDVDIIAEDVNSTSGCGYAIQAIR